MDAKQYAVGIIFTVVMLFIGLFLVQQLYTSLYPDKDVYDYTYSTATNSTVGVINLTGNQTHLVYTGALASITGEATPTKTLTCSFISNNATNQSVAVYLDGTLLGNVTVVNQTTTSSTFSDVAFAGTSANVTYQRNAATQYTLNVTSTVATYPSATTTTWMGAVAAQLTTNTSSAYSILGIGIVILLMLWIMGKFGGEKEGGM